MKYSFMTKTSFLALCVAALMPCYLLAGGGKNPTELDGKKPTRVVVGGFTLDPQQALGGDETAATSTSVVTASLLPGATEELPEEAAQAGAASPRPWEVVSSDLESTISGLLEIFRGLRSADSILMSLQDFDSQRKEAAGFGVANPGEEKTCLTMLSLIRSYIKDEKPRILALKKESDEFRKSQLLNQQNNEKNEFGERWRRVKGVRSDFNLFEKIQKEAERVAFQMRHFNEASEFDARLAGENGKLFQLLAKI